MGKGSAGLISHPLPRTHLPVFCFCTATSPPHSPSPPKQEIQKAYTCTSTWSAKFNLDKRYDDLGPVHSLFLGCLFNIRFHFECKELPYLRSSKSSISWCKSSRHCRVPRILSVVACRLQPSCSRVQQTFHISECPPVTTPRFSPVVVQRVGRGCYRRLQLSSDKKDAFFLHRPVAVAVWLFRLLQFTGFSPKTFEHPYETEAG